MIMFNNMNMNTLYLV